MESTNEILKQEYIQLHILHLLPILRKITNPSSVMLRVKSINQ